MSFTAIAAPQLRFLVYDVEPAVIPYLGGEKKEGFVYADRGYEDYENLKIACICCYRSDTQEEIVFIAEDTPDFEVTDPSLNRVSIVRNFKQFQEILGYAYKLIHFNGLSYDNRLLEAQGFFIKQDPYYHYDLLRKCWDAAGLDEDYEFPSLNTTDVVPSQEDLRKTKEHAVYTLKNLETMNFAPTKRYSGVSTAEMWQKGEYQRVISECMNDVRVTLSLCLLGWNGNLWLSPVREMVTLQPLNS